MAVSRRLRFEVLRRDNHSCRYCGGSAPDVRLTVDHVVPVSLGGKDEPGNLVAACSDCNAGKSSATPDASLVEDVQADAATWEKAKKAAAEGRSASAYLGFDEEIEWFAGEWSGWLITGRPVEKDADWKASVRVWLLRGLPIEALIELIPAAMKPTTVKPQDRWRYFCGCVWKEITKIEERATAEYQQMRQQEAEGSFLSPVVGVLAARFPHVGRARIVDHVQVAVADVTEAIEAAFGVAADRSAVRDLVARAAAAVEGVDWRLLLDWSLVDQGLLAPVDNGTD